MYERFLKKENITLFSPNDVPGLYTSFFADQDKFNELYVKYENDSSIRKKSVPATELFSLLMNERASTGRIYIQNVDHCNEHGAFNPEVAPIEQSNLCVSGGTFILTKEHGYVPIRDVVEDEVHVWNGEEWSKVTVKQTSEDSEMVLVETNNVKSIKCTPYHKFYIVDDNYKVKEVRAHELKAGDKLIKHEFPIIDGTISLENAYTNGFYSADGTSLNGDRANVYLYGDKKKLREYITGDLISETTQKLYNGETRVTLRMRGLKEKFYVPSNDVTLKDRLEWLAGYLDGDGCLQLNGDNQSIVVASNNLTFLYKIREMLECTGCTGKIIIGVPGKQQLLPDGKGGKRLFYCKTTYRLLLSSTSIKKLKNLGLNTKRLILSDHTPNRESEQFIKITSVTPVANEPTYCFTEPKRNMGVFNGILAGNCMEITLPTSPISVKNPDEGEISLCTLAAVNLGNIGDSPYMYDNMRERTELLVRFLDNLLDYQDYPVLAAEKSTRNRRPLGIGVINYAYWLAQNFRTYNEDALEPTHRLFEALQYYCLEASNTLAKEKGACNWYNHTKYSQGLLPIDTYKKSLDEICDTKYILDWEKLRENIKKYGLRNSTLTSLMPSETSSQVSNSTNGIEPPRGLVSVKVSKDGVIKQVVPGVENLGSIYPLLWNLPDNIGYLKLVAVMQKFVDQSISANTNYDPTKFPNGKVPLSVMLKDLLTAYKLGIKTLYYHNTRDGADDSQNDLDDGCAGGACKI